LIDDFADAVAGDRPSGLSAGSDAVDLAKRGAGHLAKSVVAQAAIRQALKQQGTRVSVKAVGRTAKTFGKVAGAIGFGLTGLSAYETYQQCMQE
jgi:hypothetical protein